MTDQKTALLVDRLTKVYADGTHALDALELRLPAGSFFGLLGPKEAQRKDEIRQLIPRLALTVTEAAQSIGVSTDFFAEHVAPELKWVRRGRRKLVSVRERETWLPSEA